METQIPFDTDSLFEPFWIRITKQNKAQTQKGQAVQSIHLIAFLYGIDFK